MLKRLVLIFILFISISIFLISCTSLNIPALSKQTRKEEIAVAEEYYKEAVKSEKNGDIYNTLLYLKLALEKDPKNKEFSHRYNSIINSLYSKISGTQEVVKKGAGISNPIVYKIYRNINGEIHPVQGMPVHFRLVNATGDITKKGITNDVGEAKCFIEKIDNYINNISVEAFVIIPDNVNGKRIDRLTKSFTFNNNSILDKSIKILLKSNSSFNGNGITGVILQSINKILVNNGFDNVSIMPSFNTSLFDEAISLNTASLKKLGKESSSDILILLLIDEPLNLQQSFDFYLKKISIKTIIGGTKEGNIYFNMNIDGKGADSTEKGAEDKAIENVLSKLQNILKNYLEEVKTKNEFYEFSAKSKSIIAGS